MEAEERPTKIPRLDSPSAAEAHTAETPDAAIAASIPGLPLSEAEGTHATGLQEAGLHEAKVKAEPHLTEVSASEGVTSNVDVVASPPVAAAVSELQNKDGEQQQPLSKSARKKLLRRQAWDAARPARKALRKARTAARKEEARAQRAARQEDKATGPDDGDSITTAKDGPAGSRSNRHKRATAASTPPLPVGIVLDCGFDELMTDKEIISLGSQVTRCYSENARAAPRHAKLVVAGLGGRLLQRFETVLGGTHRNWRGVEVHEAGLAELLPELKFSPESAAAAAAAAAAIVGAGAGHDDNAAMAATSIWTTSLSNPPSVNADGSIPASRTVYLTADADETLHELRPWENYVVGALVDRNRHKGICRRRAEALGLPMAKLPISEHLRMASRQVLTTNHVVEIMLRYLAGEGWAGALESVVPKRKGAVLKGKEKEKGEGEEQGDEGEEREEEEQEGAEVNDGGGGGEGESALPTITSASAEI